MATKMTKAELEKKLADQEKANEKLKEQLKRDKISVAARAHVDNSGGAAIDHLTILDNHEMPDTNREPAEDIAARMTNDLSFWGGSWCWNEAARAYGDKPEDKWFVNPTPKLIGEVMQMAPVIHNSCEAILLGEHKDELDTERLRHLEFLRSAPDAELVSECLDMLKAYQSRYFEAVQQYLGRAASYDNQNGRDNVSEEQLEKAEMRKKESAAVARRWVAKLVALVEAYHEVQSDERAYNLHYNFSAAPGSNEYNLYRWSVTQALNNIGRRLSRSIKSGALDAEQYNIPRPWLDSTRKEAKQKADTMIGDFV